MTNIDDFRVGPLYAIAILTQTVTIVDTETRRLIPILKSLKMVTSAGVFENTASFRRPPLRPFSCDDRNSQIWTYARI